MLLKRCAYYEGALVNLSLQYLTATYAIGTPIISRSTSYYFQGY